MFHRYRFWVDKAVGLFRVRQPIFFTSYLNNPFKKIVSLYVCDSDTISVV